MLGFAVIPFGRSFEAHGHVYHLSLLEPGNGMGLLWSLAVGAMAVYGVLVAAWSSNNKWSIMGGMRAAAQTLSVEIAMTLAVLAVFLRAGSLDPQQIIEAQKTWWNIGPQFPGFLVFLTCMFAESNRLPFDFAEGESEIVAGFHTEFGSMKFALLQLGEYVHLVTAAALLVTLYCGGWRVPFVADPGVALSILSFVLKLLFFCWVFIWVRWTLPRFRYDQLMSMGWKILLPLSLAHLLWHAWRMFQAGS
jgi:NADH-quinone oxidoreductase subunit H